MYVLHTFLPFGKFLPKNFKKYILYIYYISSKEICYITHLIFFILRSVVLYHKVMLTILASKCLYFF